MSGHLRENLLSDNTATLYFIDGLTECLPTKIPIYEAAPPFLTHYDFKATEEFLNMVSEKDLDLWAAEQGFNNEVIPEVTMRTVLNSIQSKHGETVSMAHDYMQQVMDHHGPFHGVIGASEGAVAAASVLIRDLEMCRENNCKSSFKCGIFMVGFPAIDNFGRWILSDDGSDLRITVPTCHIIGDQDPVACAGIALMNTCDPDSRVLISHERGHCIPHESEIMSRVGDFVRKVEAEDQSPSLDHFSPAGE